MECEYQRRYWHSKAAQFSKRERNLQIALAVLSSAAVLTALGDLRQLWVWKALSFSTAAVATALPFLNYTRESIKMCTVSSQWHQLEVEFESLWRAVENGSFSEKRLKELRNRTVEISANSADLPFDDERLQTECYGQVLIARGLKQ